MFKNYLILFNINLNFYKKNVLQLTTIAHSIMSLTNKLLSNFINNLMSQLFFINWIGSESAVNSPYFIRFSFSYCLMMNQQALSSLNESRKSWDFCPFSKIPFNFTATPHFISLSLAHKSSDYIFIGTRIHGARNDSQFVTIFCVQYVSHTMSVCVCVLLHDKILQKRIFIELSIQFQCLLFGREEVKLLFLLNFLLHTLSESIVSLFIVSFAENSCYVYFIAVSIDLSLTLSTTRLFFC